MIEGRFYRSPRWRSVESPRESADEKLGLIKQRVDEYSWMEESDTRYTFLPDHWEYFISAYIQHLSEALQKKIIKTD